jgi:hypothetical protein
VEERYINMKIRKMITKIKSAAKKYFINIVLIFRILNIDLPPQNKIMALKVITNN